MGTAFVQIDAQISAATLPGAGIRDPCGSLQCGRFNFSTVRAPEVRIDTNICGYDGVMRARGKWLLALGAFSWAPNFPAPGPSTLTARPGVSCTAAAVELSPGCQFWPSQGPCPGGAYYCVKGSAVWDYSSGNPGGKLLYYRWPSFYVSCGGANCPSAGAPCSSVLVRWQVPEGKIQQAPKGLKYFKCGR
jgi:hypothetical protein